MGQRVSSSTGEWHGKTSPGTGGDLEKAYYSYNLGAWYVVVINSECADSPFFRDGAPSCDQGSEQERWLREDLKRSPTACTLAYWHHPLFNNGARHGSSPKMKPIWQALYDFNADVVLAGHEHDYERFAPQNADGQLDPRRGIREFVVGTGGEMEKGQFASDHNSEHQEKAVIGVLKLTLHPKRYEFEYIRGTIRRSSIPAAGTATDADGANDDLSFHISAPPLD
jgi:acid phosphatase type 7